MKTKEITVRFINETLCETLDAFEKELTKLEHKKNEIPDRRDTLASLKPLAEFTEISLRCAQLIESISLLFEDATKQACFHIANGEYDKFKKDKKQLQETNKIYERYRRLIKVYNKILNGIETK